MGDRERATELANYLANACAVHVDHVLPHTSRHLTGEVIGLLPHALRVCAYDIAAQDAAAPARVHLSDTAIRVDLGPVALTSRLIDGTFPDYARVIPQGHTDAIQIDREALSAAVDRVLTVTAERKRAVRLEISPVANTVTVSVTDPDAGSASEGVATGDCTGAGGEIGLNGRYLIDALAALGGPALRLAYGDAGSAVLITPHDDKAGEKRLIVIMPMRV